MRALPAILRVLVPALLALAAAAPPAARAGRAKPDRPNIVLIMADDLGTEGLGCYGGLSYRTPALDALARSGIRFTHAYAQPLCTPTRVQLMTGRYNHRNWIAFGILDPKERTFGHHLQAAGYRTCIAGKWQLTSYDPPDYPGAASRRGIGMQPKDAGFHAYSLWHTGHTEDKGSRYADPVILQDGRFRTDTRGRYGEDLWVEYIGAFMERHRAEPFFVYYPMALPHGPFNPTPESADWKDPAKRLQASTRYFPDMVEYLDRTVGRLTARIDALGLRERTLILFYSDNGTDKSIESRTAARVVRGGKSRTIDDGTRVPLIASWKGTAPAGAVCEDLIDSTDFLPTLMEAAGAPVPRGLDGRSFLPQLRGRKGSPRDWIFSHYDPRPGWDKDPYTLVRSARDRRFRLYDDGRLFEPASDPLEERPLDPERESREASSARRKLRGVLDRHPSKASVP